MLRFHITFVLLVCAAPFAFGTSYYFPKFGTPVVSYSMIVFTEPGWEPHRIISVNRKSGVKMWETTDPTRRLSVWIAPRPEFGNRYIVTKGSDVFFCDPTDGETVQAYKTGLERCSVASHRGALVFIEGEKNDVDWLQLVDLQLGKKVWEVPEVQFVASSEGDLIICQRAKRKVNQKDKSYQHVDLRITALGVKNGRVNWEHKLPQFYDIASSFHVGGHVLVEYSGTIYCYNRSGKLLRSLNLRGEDFGSVSFCQEGARILAWFRGPDAFSGGVVYEISVPDLAKRELVETDWYAASSHVFGEVVVGQTIGRVDAYNLKTKEKIWKGGQWSWSGVHGSHIYYSAMDRDGQHAVLNKIHVETGATKLLYRELLPEDMQWKTRKRDAAMEEEGNLKSDYRAENRTKTEQAGTEQPATRPESKSEGSDKPQSEAEGRSR